MSTRARSWWVRRSPQTRAWLRWGLPLLALLALSVPFYVWHWHAGVAKPGEGRALLTRVGFVCALCCLVLLIGQRRWDVRALGILALLGGIAGLFLRVIGRRGPQPVGEPERDLIQTALDVGSAVLFVGLIWWVVATRFGWRGGEGEATDETGHALPQVPEPQTKVDRVIFDRRKGPRRHGWGRRKDDRRP